MKKLAFSILFSIFLILSCPVFVQADAQEDCTDAQVAISWEITPAKVTICQNYVWNPETLSYSLADEQPNADLSENPYSSVKITMESKTEAVVGYQIAFTPAEGVGVREETECLREGVLTPEDPNQVFQSKVYVTELSDVNPGMVRLGSYSIQLQSLEAAAVMEETPEEVPDEKQPSEEEPLEEQSVEKEPSEEQPIEEEPAEEQPSGEMPNADQSS